MPVIFDVRSDRFQQDVTVETYQNLVEIDQLHFSFDLIRFDRIQGFCMPKCSSLVNLMRRIDTEKYYYEHFKKLVVECDCCWHVLTEEYMH